MFETYLEDADVFRTLALGAQSENEKKRYYRASVVFAFASLEAFVNFVGDTFEKGGSSFQPYELALLLDKKFGANSGVFGMLSDTEYHRLEDKLKFLLKKFEIEFDFEGMTWAGVKEFKRLRDELAHSRQEEDELPVSKYKDKIERGFKAIIELMDILCLAIFRRHLRKRLRDLIP